VGESSLDEPERGVIPARIEPDFTRPAGELIGANTAACRQESNGDEHSSRQGADLRLNGKVRLIRVDAVLQRGIEEPLVRL
jgi:hypothetical protein